MLGSLVFIGWAFATLFMPRLADIYGRKYVFLANQLLQSVAISVLIFTNSFKIAAGAMFCFGMCCSGRWNAAYIYLTEFLTEPKFKIMAPFLNMCAAYPIILSSFTYQILTKNTIYIEISALVLTVVFALICLFYMPETPKYMISW